MEHKINVTGMTCMHCVGAVKKALESVDGVESAEVSLEQANAVVTGDAFQGGRFDYPRLRASRRIQPITHARQTLTGAR